MGVGVGESKRSPLWNSASAASSFSNLDWIAALSRSTGDVSSTEGFFSLDGCSAGVEATVSSFGSEKGEVCPDASFEGSLAVNDEEDIECEV